MPAIVMSWKDTKLFEVASETAKFHRNSQRDGDHAYDVVMGAFLRALYEASRYTNSLGWDGAEFSHGWASKVLSPAEQEKQGDKPYTIASLSFNRTGSPRSRSFTIDIDSDLKVTARL
ncbi:hypothetical protein CcrC1_gp254c [Caulobacter phage C1]|nr:hypothetical protein CcrC1_gp254c [Caulobacter phage C1]UTU08483.1 hypothetical protein CcrC2_gp255c [Caulobacter phage C2]UTU08998.1 hypothetical protein CcrJ4_gp249c [Caulobacter phage J4]UTU09559.1 hypothetical protein CcrBL47_gp273c [Caulobacter phage BL47]UTU10116.1 hypothetical protein CcrRB23_gp254c [Caulobacter phage RB23]WGN97151.1 hypothetical protein [Bertelyvirus sp.]